MAATLSNPEYDQLFGICASASDLAQIALVVLANLAPEVREQIVAHVKQSIQDRSAAQTPAQLNAVRHLETFLGMNWKPKWLH